MYSLRHADAQAAHAACRGCAVKSGTSTGAEVESRGSWPQMALSTSAVSRTSRVNGPIWSSELAKATSP